MQGVLQGRPGEDRLAADGGAEEALPDTLGSTEHGSRKVDDRPSASSRSDEVRDRRRGPEPQRIFLRSSLSIALSICNIYIRRTSRSLCVVLFDINAGSPATPRILRAPPPLPRR